METIRSVTSALDEKPHAYTLIEATTLTHKAMASAGEARLIRFVKTTWEPSTWSKYVSKLFSVTKPGINNWRFMVDL
jgi:hypothetical protein